MRPMSQRQQVISMISDLSLRHNMRLMKILVISLRVSKSISLDLRQEMMIVLIWMFILNVVHFLEVQFTLKMDE